MLKTPDYFIGIDVSKHSLSVCILYKNTTNHFEIANEKEEITKFFAMYANLKSFATFENTNTYNYDLMRVFDELGLAYSRLDAFKFAHFLKHNSKNKTDKSDAYALALYGSKFYAELSQGSFSQDWATIKSYQSGLELINKISTQLKNFKEALKNVGNENLNEAINNILDCAEEQKEQVENEVFELTCELVPQTKQILAENKGLGRGFCVYVVPVLYMNKHKSPAQIASYLGLVPRLKESGISIKGAGHIGGGARCARSALYMCALSAARFNDYFSEKYNGFLSRGKPKKIALTAISRKIIVFVKNKYFI